MKICLWILTLKLAFAYFLRVLTDVPLSDHYCSNSWSSPDFPRTGFSFFFFGPISKSLFTVFLLFLFLFLLWYTETSAQYYSMQVVLEPTESLYASYAAGESKNGSRGNPSETGRIIVCCGVRRYFETTRRSFRKLRNKRCCLLHHGIHSTVLLKNKCCIF